MAPLNDLIYLVQPHVRGCPEPLITAAILRAARSFCRVSRWLRESIVIDAVADQQFYALAPAEENEEVLRIEAAEYAGTPLVPVLPGDIPQMEGCPYGYFYLPSREIAIIDVPSEALLSALAVSVSKLPIKTATSISDELVAEHEQVIAAGALGELLLMPGAWRDLEVVDVHRATFLDGCRDARAKADLQHQAFNHSTVPCGI